MQYTIELFSNHNSHRLGKEQKLKLAKDFTSQIDQAKKKHGLEKAVKDLMKDPGEAVPKEMRVPEPTITARTNRPALSEAVCVYYDDLQVTTAGALESALIHNYNLTAGQALGCDARHPCRRGDRRGVPGGASARRRPMPIQLHAVRCTRHHPRALLRLHGRRLLLHEMQARMNCSMVAILRAMLTSTVYRRFQGCILVYFPQVGVLLDHTLFRRVRRYPIRLPVRVSLQH